MPPRASHNQAPVDPMPSPPRLRLVGETAVVAIASAEQVVSPLDSFQQQVINLISLGQTTAQIARQLDTAKPTITQSHKDILDIYQTKSASVAVRKAIEDGSISVELSTDSAAAKEVPDLDKKLLRYYANGGSNANLVKRNGIKMRKIEALHDQFLCRMQAWSRPHAVRRGFELGILTKHTIANNSA